MPFNARKQGPKTLIVTSVKRSELSLQTVSVKIILYLTQK